MTNERIPVLVVGAGPVGLALAGDLAWRGVASTVLERTDGAIYQPKMDYVGVRTMEFCRRWGIVPQVEASPYNRDWAQDNVYATSLTGYELGREPFPCPRERKAPPQSPQRFERCPQDMFDPILRAWVETFPQATLRYRTELLDFEHDHAGVRARVRDLERDTVHELKADYLVGCDGAASLVAKSLGIDYTGRAVLTNTTNLIFRSPQVRKILERKPAYRHIFVGPEGTWATLVAIDGWDRFRMSIVRSPREGLTEAEIAAAIRRIVGTEVEFEVLSAVPWTRRELVAQRYSVGRVFIAGDSAHVMSPTGGFGMNTGIGDAVDLSWKLEARLAGWGGPVLFDAYTFERRPVAERNAQEASGNLGRMLSPGEMPLIEADTPEGAAFREKFGREFSELMKREWYTLGIHLGYRYDASPICVYDETPAPPLDTATYVQSTHPGARAPHVWLRDGRSTLDLFGRGFVLVRTDPAVSTAALEAAALELNVPLQVVTLDEPDVKAVYERALVLVRPDGHVAWRADTVPADPPWVIGFTSGWSQASRAHQMAPR